MKRTTLGIIFLILSNTALTKTTLVLESWRDDDQMIWQEEHHSDL